MLNKCLYKKSGNLLNTPRIYIYIYIYMHVFTNPFARAGYDTRSVFKRCLTDFPLDRLVALQKLKKPVCPTITSSSRENNWIHIYHHHHDVVPLARISLTLSRHFSLSFITSGRSSGLHPVSSHSCCMYVRAGRPAFPRPYVGVYRSTSLMSSSLLRQQCPACLVRLTCIVFVMEGRWPYNWCLVGCCHQDLFNIARSILV